MKNDDACLSRRRLRRAEGTLARVTGGRRAWDPETLHCAAMNCLLNGKAHDFEGRPHDAAEMGRFAAAWRKVQLA